MSKILVTGGAGFIGCSLVNELLQSKNDQVWVFDNLSKGSERNISNCFRSLNFKLIQGDMLDISSLGKAVDNCDIVYHLAANSEVRSGYADTKIDYEQNLLATYNLLEAMRKSATCKKIVFTSSSTVYGEPEVIPTSEKYSPLIPISLYGATKLACEAMISGYCNMFNMSGVVLRLANIIGPRSTHGVIYDFFTKLSTDCKSLEILGNGKQNKSYLFIDDCISALIFTAGLVMETQNTFDIFNLGSSDAINVLDIAKIVMKELSLKNVSLRFTDSIEDGRGWKGDVKEMLLDSSKMRSLGWKARYNSRDAVTRTSYEIIHTISEPMINFHRN